MERIKTQALTTICYLVKEVKGKKKEKKQINGKDFREESEEKENKMKVKRKRKRKAKGEGKRKRKVSFQGLTFAERLLNIYHQHSPT